MASRQTHWRKRKAAASQQSLNQWLRATSPSFIFRRLVNRARLKDKSLGRLSTISTKYVAGIYKKQQGKCLLSGEPLTFLPGWHATNASIDRINPKKGYVKGNVRLVCCWVNLARHVLTDVEFLAWCKRVLRKARL